MGTMKSIMTVLQNYFPKEDDYDKLFIEFYEWLNDEKRNMMFVVTNKPGIYLDLCNNKAIHVDEVAEYWCKHIKLDIHDGEGFVINDNEINK